MSVTANTKVVTHLLWFCATVIVVFGILALYYPHILQNTMPSRLFDLLQYNYWLSPLIFASGIALTVLAFGVNLLATSRSPIEFAK